MSPPERPLRPVRMWLLGLVLAALLPGVLGAAALLAYQLQQTRDQLEQSTLQTVRALSQAVDNHLLKVQATAQALATSDALQRGDLVRFQAIASEALARTGVGTAVVLRDRDGRQLVNTLSPAGGPPAVLPGGPPLTVFTTGKPFITDLFIGPVLGKPIIAVEVPVPRKGPTVYSLAIGVLPEDFNQILQQQGLPPSWVAGVVDRAGRYVARSDLPTAVGQPPSPGLQRQLSTESEGMDTAIVSEGRAVYAFHSRSPITGWTVLIAIPHRVLDRQVQHSALLLLAGVAALVGIGLLLTRWIAGRISWSLHNLERGARAVGAGQEIQPPAAAIAEVAQVGAALSQASQLLAQRTATLRESQARFKALADNIAQLAWMTDAQGRVQWFNRRWYDYTGGSLDDLQDERWQRFYDPQTVQDVVHRFRAQIARGQPWEDTLAIRDREGQYHWFLSRAFPLRDGRGHVVSWFGTDTDVTVQREAAQALLEADRRKDEYIAMLAHELRNPLAPVRNAVEVLRRSGLPDPRLQRACDIIVRQVAHMARLLDDLLDTARAARGRLSVQLETCDLAAIAEQTAADHEGSLQALGLELRLRAQSGPLWVRGDPVRLAQMVGNLLANAARFNVPGGWIELETTRDSGAGLALVRVRDGGIGIAPEMLERLFQPFVQAGGDPARSRGGLGLGLALTRSLARLHGGEVRARSDGLGRGAEFTLSIPLAPPPAAPAEADAQAQDGS